MSRPQDLPTALKFPSRKPELHASPYKAYQKLRTHNPIFYRPEQEDWLLTRYDDVAEVLQDDVCYGHAYRSTTLEQQAAQNAIDRFLQLRQDSQFLIDQWVVLKNPPEHSRLRNLLRPCFTPKKVKELRAEVKNIIDDLINRVDHQGSMDIIGDLAYPLPVQVIRHIMGIPKEAEHPHLKRWSHDLGLMVDLDTTALACERSFLAMMGLAHYFRDLLAKWHTFTHTTDGLISKLLQAQAEENLSEAELVGNCIFLFVGGHLTTQNLIGNGILALLQHPPQLKLLQQQPDLAPKAVQEILRYDPPIQIISRTALSTTVLAGNTIKAGQIVHCVLGAANRDPDKFSTPDRFDFMRKSQSNLAFGYGTHYCLGSHLAQLEGEIAIQALISRFPDLKLATQTLEWENNLIVHGVISLHVEF